MTVKKPILKKLLTNQTAVNGMIANHNSSQLPAITSSKQVKNCKRKVPLVLLLNS